MSGSGSSGGFFDEGGSGGGSGGRPKDDCATLVYKTQLSSPNPDTLSKVELKTVLTLRVEDNNGPVYALLPNGEVVGSILNKALNIINCVEEGYSFDATVLEIDNGRCVVEIRPISGQSE